MTARESSSPDYRTRALPGATAGFTCGIQLRMATRYLDRSVAGIMRLMNRLRRTLVLLLVLILLTPTLVTAQESGGISDFIIRTNAHKIGGYVTLGLALTTAGMGLLGYDVHPYLGYATAGFAATAALAGTIAYKDLLPVVWPHAVLNALAVTGFVLNAFVLEGGSAAHITIGASSVALLGAAYASILLIMR